MAKPECPQMCQALLGIASCGVVLARQAILLVRRPTVVLDRAKARDEAREIDTALAERAERSDRDSLLERQSCIQRVAEHVATYVFEVVVPDAIRLTLEEPPRVDSAVFAVAGIDTLPESAVRLAQYLLDLRLKLDVRAGTPRRFAPT